MIPIRDNIPSRSIPVVNYTIVALCAVAFFFQVSDPRMTEQFGMIPARVIGTEREITITERFLVERGGNVFVVEQDRPVEESPIPAWLTLVTSVFLHGGWLHILGNLWFLYIFGDNVEDRFGHWGYLAFYLGCGILAGLSHLATDPDSMVPTIGASGAIAGVMGAYLILYPHARVLCIIPIFIFLHMAVLPAPLFLGVWFLIQFFQGTFAITAAQQTGVAWWAHIGGFAVGVVVAWLLGSNGKLRPRVEEIRPNTDGLRFYRIRR